MSRLARCLGACLLLAACVNDAPPEATSTRGPVLALTITPTESGTDVLLQAVSIVDASTVWVSGHGGTWAVTRDGGESWSASVMAGEEELQFRDVHAFDDSTAYLMSAVEGGLSRIYRTDDGGDTWVLQYQAQDPAAFLDCMAFWDRDRGLVYGDAVDGVPFILRTEDGGASWWRVGAGGLPEALESEGGFAASGTCLATGLSGEAWIAAGNAERARTFRTEDWGVSWEASESPMVAGPAAGHTTLLMLDDGRGIALGGVIGNDSTNTDNAVVTDNGGWTWTLTSSPAMPGPVYGSALAMLERSVAVVAVGPRGLSWSPDFGRGWTWADSTTYWAAGFATPEAGWAVGPEGRIARLELAYR